MRELVPGMSAQYFFTFLISWWHRVTSTHLDREHLPYWRPACRAGDRMKRHSCRNRLQAALQHLEEFR